MNKNLYWDETNSMPAQREFEAYHNTSDTWCTPAFHAHEFYEFYFFISGSLDIVLENHAYQVAPNSMLIFPPGYMHRAVIKGDGRYERLFLYVSIDCLRNMSGEGFDLLDIIETQVKRSHFYFQLDREFFLYIVQQVDTIIREAVYNDAAKRLINRCRFNALLARICQSISTRQEEATTNAPSLMNDLILYIQENLSDKLSLDSLAARFYISKYHLLHEFKAYTNTSLYRYILTKRIILAKKLLLTGTSSGDVCLQCGFSDYSAFYKAFRKETNLSPRQYTERAAEKEI